MAVHGGLNMAANPALILDATADRSWQDGNTYWYDLSGNGNHAQAFNSPGLANNGFAYRAIQFDGANDYFEIDNNQVSMDFLNGQSVGVVYYHSFTTSRRNIWDQAYGGTGTWTHEQGGSINYYHGSAGSNSSPYVSRNSSTTTRNQWNYHIVTRGSDNVKWYLNGSLVTSGTSPYTPMSTQTTANIRIGYGYTGVYWAGSMIMVHAYNRELTALEVETNYKALKNRLPQ